MNQGKAISKINPSESIENNENDESQPEFDEKYDLDIDAYIDDCELLSMDSLEDLQHEIEIEIQCEQYKENNDDLEESYY